MSHELFGERFFSRDKPGWHQLGTVFNGELSPTEAVQKADMDFSITTEPLMVELGGVATSYGKVAIVREPTKDDDTYRIFGEAREGYTVLQNMELAEVIEPLAERWPLETIGALEQGKTAFITLNAGEAEVNGDPVKQYFLLNDTRDGRSALNISFTPVRVVCWNTLTAGKAAAIASANLRHTESIRQETEWHVKLLGQMQQVQSKMMSAFDVMAQAALKPAALKRIAAAAYPHPRKPRKVVMREQLSKKELEQVGGLLEAVDKSNQIYEAAVARADERRTIVLQLTDEFNDGHEDLANTAWAAYNAVVEFEDYRESQGKEADPVLSALFGQRAKVKEMAYAAAFAEAQKA